MSEIKQDKLPKIKIASFAFLLLLLLFSCGEKVPQTPDEKAKKLIAELFEAPKNGTYHYEAGAFGKLDSALRPIMMILSTKRTAILFLSILIKLPWP